MSNHAPPASQTDTAPSQHVFTYGSLMFDDIFLGVTSTSPERVRARLTHWSRHGLRDREYPGAIPDPGGEHFIDGVLWLNLTESALAALDQFEGAEYERIRVQVDGNDATRYDAWVYRWLLPQAICGSWSQQTFELRHRQTFVFRHGRHR